MRDHPIFRVTRPYLTAIAATVMVVLLIVAIYFTRIDLQWVAFPGGILVAAILAMTSRASHSEWLIARRSAQLSASKEKLAQETKLRVWAEKAAAASRARLQFTDEKLPVMLVYIDAGQHCCYHNHAFRQCLGLEPNQIDGRLLREVLGDKFYGEIESSITEVMAGKTVHNERTRKLTSGSICHLYEQYIPDFGSEGKIAGFYALYTDITGWGDLPPAEGAENAAAEPGSAATHTGSSEKELFDNTFGEQVTGWEDSSARARITEAIEEGEFRLYCQAITPMKADAGLYVHHEILIRMVEEEDNLMPPGAFLPLVEKFGMLTRLDRWVVSRMLKWLSAHPPVAGTMFCINVAGDTLSDPDFTDFVLDQLQETGVVAGVLCFEIEESDAAARRADTSVFVRKVRQHGCHVSLCSFGRDRASFDLLKNIKVDFLKIDGGMVCNMLRDPINLAKVTAINRVAHVIGIRTIAEMVETDEVAAKLREIGLDFAQGFGIALPRPLEELE